MRQRSRALGMTRAVWLTIALPVLTLPVGIAAQESRTWNEQQWGLGFTFRTASIPFATAEKTVATVIPLIMYEGRWVYFYETEGGIKVVENDRWRLSAMGRIHFFDIPAEFQNEIQGDRMDWGVQIRHKPWTGGSVDLELLSDRDGHSSVRSRLGNRWRSGRLRVDAFADVAYRSRQYNSYFWGLTQEEVGAGVDFTAGANAYFHVVSSLYLHGAFASTYLSRPVRAASLVEDAVQWRGFLGFGMSNDRREPPGRVLTTAPYWRLAHHWATPSTMGEILRGNAVPDPLESRLTSVFYGLPLTDRVFTLPIPIYLHSGVGVHWPSDYQDTAFELIMSIKATYTIPLPWRVRIGMAEGVSMVSEVPARERENQEAKGFKPAEYMNYLDPSVDLNLGDVFPWKFLEDVWLGYVVHHRSAIFENAQQFGRLKGGSNYQGVYLQFSR